MSECASLRDEKEGLLFSRTNGGLREFSEARCWSMSLGDRGKSTQWWACEEGIVDGGFGRGIKSLALQETLHLLVAAASELRTNARHTSSTIYPPSIMSDYLLYAVALPVGFIGAYYLWTKLRPVYVRCICYVDGLVYSVC